VVQKKIAVLLDGFFKCEGVTIP